MFGPRLPGPLRPPRWGGVNGQRDDAAGVEHLAAFHNVLRAFLVANAMLHQHRRHAATNLLG